MRDKTLNVLVVGQGALGSLLAMKLQQQGHQVALQLRNRTTDTPVVRTLDEQSVEFPLVNEQTRPDIIFAAIKAYDVEGFLLDYKTRWPLSKQPQLILSYNGMLLNESAMLATLPCQHFITTHGAYLEGNKVIHTGRGESWLSATGCANNDQMAEAFNQALPPVHLSQNIASQRWLKLAVNCIINPLTALAGQSNQVVLDAKHQSLKLRLALEFSAVAKALGQSIEAIEILARVDEVARQTAENKSSMWQDLQAGRRTEIDFLNGFIARQAEQLELPAKAHQQLWQEVSQASLSSIKSTTSKPKPDSAE